MAEATTIATNSFPTAELDTDKKAGEVVKITITLPSTAYFISGIRDFTLSLTKNMTGFSEQWAYRFQSVVDELCNNAIEHGSSRGSEIRLVLESVAKSFIDITVEDTGTGPVPKTAEEMKKLLEERRSPSYLKNVGLRGRGLPQIVLSWTDEIEFKDREGGGLSIRVRKHLKEEDNIQAMSQSKDPTNLTIKN